MNDAILWRATAIGLRLKLVAGLVLLAVPVTAIIGSRFGLSAVMVAAACIFAASCLDLCGRSLCLAAPVRRRYPIVLSVGLHAAAVAGIVVLTVLEGEPGLYVGLAAAACIQIFVAGLFTLFLGETALALNRPDLHAGVSRLQLTLTTGTIVATATVSYVLLVAAIVILYGAFSYGLGFCIGVPLGILAIVPWMAMAIIPLTLTFLDYGKSVMEIRRAAAAAARTPDAAAPGKLDVEILPK
jgi:hypothetical protein